SPVLRGKFVLGQLLCSAPAPPPPGVAPLDEQSDAQTVREQLEQHQTDPVCASCHVGMDDIGFGLENFDGIGRWRDEDAGYPIDATGEIDGQSFDGPRELVAILAADRRFPRCMVQQAFAFALGRLPDDADGPYLDTIQDQFAAGGYTFESLAVALATSAPFTTRRG